MFKTQNLYQNDEKWKNVKLGQSSDETIGGWGCLLTSATMILYGLGHNETPETVNDKMRANGGFKDAFFIPSVLPYIFPNVIYKDMQPCESYPAPVAQIDAAVAAGKPVILQVDWNKQAGIQTHFVLVKEKKDDDYAIYDPYKYSGDGPDKEVLLTQRYRHNGATLETEISAVIWFDGTIPPSPPPSTEVPVPQNAMKLYVTEDDLALRAEPSLGGYLWKRMKAGDELISLEDATTTKAKLGVQGQWLQVQDPIEKQGYTAAWYLSENPATGSDTSSSTPAGAPLPPGALALIPTDEVAFRTQPVIAPDTLIRHVPVTEQIISLEPPNQTIAKVGVVNQWLNVQDGRGQTGFMAAWYLNYASGSTAQQTEVPAAAPGEPIRVKTTAEGVAFRSEPIISGRTILRRLPLGTELTIAEPGGENKLGSNSQWLKVKDGDTTDGYIAAWFVAHSI